jgi:hypothetical protein
MPGQTAYAALRRLLIRGGSGGVKPSGLETFSALFLLYL